MRTCIIRIEFRLKLWIARLLNLCQFPDEDSNSNHACNKEEQEERVNHGAILSGAVRGASEPWGEHFVGVGISRADGGELACALARRAVIRFSDRCSRALD